MKIKVQDNELVYVGYGKYVKTDKIIAIEPRTGRDRGEGERTNLYVENISHPLVVSRTHENIIEQILSEEMNKEHIGYEILLDEILENIGNVNESLRQVIQISSGWDLVDLENRLRRILGQEATEYLDDK